MMPSSLAGSMIDGLCGGIIFFRTASLPSSEHCIIRSSIAPETLDHK
jgi:hypothetical protein